LFTKNTAFFYNITLSILPVLKHIANLFPIQPYYVANLFPIQPYSISHNIANLSSVLIYCVFLNV